MVALHDYDPFHSGASGLRPPHEQLSLKKGDVMTAFGDMDVNGFYRVDLNGNSCVDLSYSTFTFSSILRLLSTFKGAFQEIFPTHVVLEESLENYIKESII